MNSASSYIKGMLSSMDTLEEGDYLDAEQFLCCGSCHGRKQMDITLKTFGGQGQQVMRVPVTCPCMQQELEEETRRRERKQLRERIDWLRKEGMADPACRLQTFAQDDGGNAAVSDLCRRYADHWDDMRDSNTGLLLYGSVGTGKSFLACCIANALLDRAVRVCVTSFPRILSRLQGLQGEARTAFVDSLQRNELLVIDDLGVERDTPYALEQVYHVIDSRARSGLPLIVTTNLSISDLQQAPALETRRIYDRVLELCPVRVKMVGESRRAANAEKKRSEAKRLLEGG